MSKVKIEKCNWLIFRSNAARKSSASHTTFYFICLAFASQIDEVIKERLRCLQNLQEKVTAFKHQLVTEEEISRKMTPKVNLPN